jgi:uncharacterized membrane protein HdeD (DUF308 family)
VAVRVARHGASVKQMNPPNWVARASIVLVVCLATIALPRSGRARPDDISVGAISFASLGAVGALVSGFGSFAHITRREHSGWWGWLALASATSLTAGAIVVAEREPDARVAASVAIPLGVATFVTGVVGLVLPTPELRRRRERRRWTVMPSLGQVHGPRAVTTYGFGGVF